MCLDDVSELTRIKVAVDGASWKETVVRHCQQRRLSDDCETATCDDPSTKAEQHANPVLCGCRISRIGWFLP